MTITKLSPTIPLCSLMEILRVLEKLNNALLTQRVAIILAQISNPPAIFEE